MTGQPPEHQPGPPSEQPVQTSPPTQPVTAAGSASAAPRPVTAQTSVRHGTASTRVGRWVIVGAAALAAVMLVGTGIAGFAVLRFHDRVSLVGSHAGGHHGGPGFARWPGQGGGDDSRLPGVPGVPGDRAQGPDGLGVFMGGSALHGDMTANVLGSVQSLVFQRGEVTAVSGTSIALKSSDGFVGTYTRTAATTSSGADPVKGTQAFVLARTSDKVAITMMSTQVRTLVPPSD